MTELMLSNAKVCTTILENVLVFEPKIFRDFRGDYLEMYNEADYTKAIKELTGQEVNFVQDSMSCSYKDVLRGVHGDPKTWKLVDCSEGRIYLVIVNCRPEDDNFGKWQSFSISETDRKQVLVPPMFGTSHLVLSNRAIFHYKQSTYYDPKSLQQFSYRYDDSRFNIWWPIKNPLLSQRDESVNTDKVERMR